MTGCEAATDGEGDGGDGERSSSALDPPAAWVRRCPARLRQSLNLADVHLVSQLPAFTGIVVPSKLFGAMAVGKPSVMVGPGEAECARIIRENEAGMVVDNGDVAGLVGAIRTLREDAGLRRRMGANARRALVQKYSRRIACGRIERILVDAVVRRDGSR